METIPMDALQHALQWCDLNSLFAFRASASTGRQCVWNMCTREINDFKYQPGATRFIHVGKCHHCGAKHPTRQFPYSRYTMDYMSPILISCERWACRLKNFMTFYLDTVHFSDRTLLLRPLPATHVDVPRSDGSVTRGILKNKFVQCTHGEFWVQVCWYEDEYIFIKSVPLSYYNHAFTAKHLQTMDLFRSILFETDFCRDMHRLQLPNENIARKG